MHAESKGAFFWENPKTGSWNPKTDFAGFFDEIQKRSRKALLPCVNTHRCLPNFPTVYKSLLFCDFWQVFI